MKTWGNFLVRRVVVVTVLVSTHSLTCSWKRRPLGGVLSAMLTETVCVWALLGRRGSRPWDGEGVIVWCRENPRRLDLGLPTIAVLCRWRLFCWNPVDGDVPAGERSGSGWAGGRGIESLPGASASLSGEGGFCRTRGWCACARRGLLLLHFRVRGRRWQTKNKSGENNTTKQTNCEA